MPEGPEGGLTSAVPALDVPELAVPALAGPFGSCDVSLLPALSA